MSTTARKAWLKLLRYAGVKHFRATSGLGLPYVCHVGDESGEGPFYQLKYSVTEIVLMSAWCSTIESPAIFDIGANNGFIATQLAQLLRKNNPRIYAFEPVPSTFAQLQFSVESLGLREIVSPICRAVSDSSGEVKLFYNPRQSLFAQVRNDAENLRVGVRSVIASAVTVDEMIDSLGVRPTLIKVDVEGVEPLVFRGAARVLTSDAPPAICFEWNPLTLSEVNSSALEITRSLVNYRLYYIDDFEGQRRPLAEEISDLADIGWVCNVFAVPRDRLSMWHTAKSKAVKAVN